MKAYYRIVSTIRVIELIDVAGTLTSCLQFGCPRPNGAYRGFVDLFHKLYLSTALFMNNPDLIRQVETAFNTKWTYTTRNEYELKAWKFLNLFKAYEVQMKEDGLYNPEITKTDRGLDGVWKGSI